MEDSTASKDPIERAIESAESFIAFKTREKPLLSEESDGPVTRSVSGSVPDPEQSLFLSPPADQSLFSEGLAFQWPSNKSASSQATLPQSVEDNFSPKQSLHALVNRVTDSVVLESPTVETLQKVLQERDKDIEVAAKLGQFLLVRNETVEADLTRTLEQKELLEQQLRHSQQAVVKKDELLRLYASEQQEDPPPSVGGAVGVVHTNKAQTEWLNVLSEECRELRESNSQLHAEADLLKKATAEVEQQEKELMQRCMEQFSEAKKRLSEVREEAEHKDEENMRLQEELECLHGNLEELQQHHEECVGEVDMLKEQLTDSQENNIHMLQQLTDAQLNLEEAKVLLKEVREENESLKEMAADQPASSPADSGHVEHESIVKEIEEVLRKEIIAASTLTERPRSPNNYAQQRAMVVMETVRAATLASSRRQKRRRDKPSPLGNSAPLTTSSPKQAGSAARTGNGMQHNLSLPTHLTSPVSGKGTDQLQEELIRYRQQNYVAPEKLQIVKPMEGSVTLLKWKLLASPQLGGATTYFSDASRPGVHLKKWKAGGVRDIGSLTDQNTRNSSQTPEGMRGIGSLAEGDRNSSPSPVRMRGISSLAEGERNGSPSPVRMRGISSLAEGERNGSPSPVRMRGISSLAEGYRNISPSPVRMRGISSLAEGGINQPGTKCIGNDSVDLVYSGDRRSGHPVDGPVHSGDRCGSPVDGPHNGDRRSGSPVDGPVCGGDRRSGSPVDDPVKIKLPSSPGKVDVASWLKNNSNSDSQPSSGWSHLGGCGYNTIATHPDFGATTDMKKTQAESGIGMRPPLSTKSGIGIKPPPKVGTEVDSAAADTGE